MKTDSASRTVTRYAVEVEHEPGDWMEMPGFSSDDLEEAKSGQAALQGKPFNARVIEIVTYTKVSETQVWPHEWTEQRDLCHHNGLADHDAHIISRERGQFCRGNGPFMAEKGWVPSDDADSAQVH